MERHPVPQNIMDVEFKLFGALTIRQFGYLAGGFVFALFFYLSGLPQLLSLFLIVFSVIMGLFLSLVKINGQASATWVSNFILALFTSQQRIWRKTAVTPEILTETKTATLTNKDIQTIRKASTAQDRVVRMPLENLAATQPTELDNYEKERLSQIEEHFDFATKGLEKPESAVKREVRMPKAPEPVNLEEIAPRPKTLIIKPENDNLAGRIGEHDIVGEPVITTVTESTVLTPMATVNVNRPFPAKTALQVTPRGEQPQVPAVTEETQPREQVKTEIKVEEKKQIPEEPQGTRKPNIVLGIVVDKGNRPLADAVVELKDEKERLIRKIKTISNGTFTLATPLPNGTYHVDISLQGFKFDRFQLILSGIPLPGYKFRAK